MSQAGNTYDEIPYGDNVFHYTHPACLGAVGVLYGMRPANAERSRVLELGCASGGNLISMAYDLPDSEFVGIELSQRQIDEGRKTISALGLRNINLRAGSILDVNDDFGRFDYIVCHGVYSWVPAEIREAILRVCKRNLAPNGIAYISYNTYPGWRLRGMIREMMLFHASEFKPQEQVSQGRALLNFLAQASPGHDPAFRDIVRREAERVSKLAESYVLHDYLETENAPVYFHQLAEQASSHGLRYVAEAHPNPIVQQLTPEVLRTLGRLSASIIRTEQYLDFVTNEHFRRSLWCHHDVEPQRPLRVENLTRMYLTGLGQPLAQAVDSVGFEKFQAPDGGELNTNNPVKRAALHVLFEAAPAAIAFDHLLEQVHRRVPSHVSDIRGLLVEAMLFCYQTRHVDLSTLAPKLTIDIGERPFASALARLQAAAGHVAVCNLRHEQVMLDPFDREVLQHLDGTRSPEELRAQAAAQGETKLDASLALIARSGLLVAPSRLKG